MSPGKNKKNFYPNKLGLNLYRKLSNSNRLNVKGQTLQESVPKKPELQIRGGIEDNSKIIFLIS